MAVHYEFEVTQGKEKTVYERRLKIPESSTEKIHDDTTWTDEQIAELHASEIQRCHDWAAKLTKEASDRGDEHERKLTKIWRVDGSGAKTPIKL